MGSDFDELDARYRKRLLGHARMLSQGAPWLDLDDLVQETLVRYLEHVQKGLHDATRGDAMGWLLKVMKDRFIDLWRRETSQRKAEDDPTITRYTLTNDDVPATYERITPERFDWAIEKLPENQRLTLLLKAKGLENKEIAHRLGINPGAVAQRLFNARRTLHQILQPYTEEGIH